MKRAFRIQSSDNIMSVVRGGRKFESPFFRMYIRRNAIVHPRFAFIISKKIDTRAVARNTMRRRASEWFRNNISLNIQPFDVAVVFKKGAENLSKKNFYEALRALVHNLHDY